MENYILPIVASVITAVITYIMSRPKEKVDIAGNILSMSEKITDRLEAQLSKADEMITSLKHTIITMQKENDDCWLRVSSLQTELANYERLYNEQVLALKLLREDCESLRKLLKGKEINEN